MAQQQGNGGRGPENDEELDRRRIDVIAET